MEFDNSSMPESENLVESPSKSSYGPLISETQRVLEQQISIVQNQQSQSTKVIRVALTIGGLLLTLSSILLSVASSDTPAYLAEGFSEFSLSDAGVVILFGYLGVLMIIMIVFILLSALEVLEPHAETNEQLIAVSTMSNAKIQIPKPIHDAFQFYRKFLLPPPFSNVLTHNISREQTTLRPGLDAEEIQNIQNNTDSFEEKFDRIIEYNAGCIEKNEKLIKTNRQRLSKIYSISSLLVVLFGSVIAGLGISFIL